MVNIIHIKQLLIHLYYIHFLHTTNTHYGKIGTKKPTQYTLISITSCIQFCIIVLKEGLQWHDIPLIVFV